MARHPIDGIKGSKPRVPGVKSAERADGKVSRAELSRLNREYLESRNRAQAAKAATAEMEIAQRRGQLISRKLVGFQAAYLLTIFRQRTLLAPVSITRKLTALGLIDAGNEHIVSEAIKEDVYALLADLANLPSRCTDPDWVKKIDHDLVDQVDGNPSARRMTPEEVRAQAEQAKSRRQKKTETMRKLRAEGRVKS
jgi:hypothetical protein